MKHLFTKILCILAPTLSSHAADGYITRTNGTTVLGGGSASPQVWTNDDGVIRLVGDTNATFLYRFDFRESQSPQEAKIQAINGDATGSAIVYAYQKGSELKATSLDDGFTEWKASIDSYINGDHGVLDLAFWSGSRNYTLLDPMTDFGDAAYRFESYALIPNTDPLFIVNNSNINVLTIKGTNIWEINGVSYYVPSTNGLPNQALVTDGGTPQQLSYGGPYLAQVDGLSTNVTLYGKVTMETTSDSSHGVLWNGSGPFFHKFALAGTSGRNLFLGNNSGNFSLTGSIGDQGSFNTAIGDYTLPSLTSGLYNTALGYAALLSDTTGDQNTAIGVSALVSNIAGFHNTSVGDGSSWRINGNENTVLGWHSISSMLVGDNNTSIGGGALYNSLSGSNNTAIGDHALSDATNSMSRNVALGFSAGKYCILSDSFYVDNQDRGSDALDKVGALLYGKFNATPGSQTLRVNGFLGIGVTPATSLDVASTATFRNNLDVGPGVGGITWDAATSGMFNIYGGSGKGLSFGVNSSFDKMIIDTSGNVGIGPTVPGAKLDVTGTIRASSTVTASQFIGPGTITNYTTYAAGTAYTLTGSSAALDFGTTDPVLTINQTGTYLIQANVGVKYSGATYVAAQTVTFKLRRTNNTAADLSNGSRAVELPVLTTFTGGDVMTLPPVVYAATSGDTVTIYGILSATPSAGSVDADSAEVIAIRLF